MHRLAHPLRPTAGTSTSRHPLKGAHNLFSRALSCPWSHYNTSTASQVTRVTPTDHPYTAKLDPANKAAKSYGVFVTSGSANVAESLSCSGVDWLCLDCQHGPVGYAELAELLRATACGTAKSIVRVGGPTDRFGIQQALDLGADGVMIPLVNTPAEAREAVSYCRFPPEGQRSVVYPSRAVLKGGVGPPALTAYLKEANKQVEVWVQVESAQCLEQIEGVLAVPGITCAFLGPADMACSMALHVQYKYDLVAALGGPEIAGVYDQVLQACQRHGVAPGAFCLGAPRAADLAKRGYQHIGYDVDINVLTSYAASSMRQLKSAESGV